MKHILAALLIAAPLPAYAFTIDEDHPHYILSEGLCKSDATQESSADCTQYLHAPDDIAEVIDGIVECKSLAMFIDERKELGDEEGETHWQQQSDAKCSDMEYKRLTLLKQYWAREDLKLEGKAEFLDDLIRLPENLVHPHSAEVKPAENILPICEFPADVENFLKKDRDCFHFAGEINGDRSERDQEVAGEMEKLGCNGVESQRIELLRKYSTDKTVSQALLFYAESEMEGHAACAMEPKQ